MTNLVPAFNTQHPFWEEAIGMRKKEGASIAAITRRADELGFSLSYRQIDLGLKRAPITAISNIGNALWLRRRYESMEDQFNSYTAMRDLAQEALAKAGEFEDELAFDENLTVSRRMMLEHDRDKWLKTAFEWAEKCARLDIDLGGLVLKQQQIQSEEDKPKENVADAVAKVLEDFKAQLPKVSKEDLLAKYGGNIKMPDEKEHDIQNPDGE